MRHKTFPALDSGLQEYEDRFGPLNQEVRGLDRLIGEGAIEVPESDPAVLVLELTDEVEEATGDDSSLPYRKRIETWFLMGDPHQVPPRREVTATTRLFSSTDDSRILHRPKRI